MQITETVPPKVLFSHYNYFSSVAETTVLAARQLADRLIAERKLNGNSLVLEAASNDGYLLQHYRDRGIRVLGIEPAANIAHVAAERGIPTRCAFFDLAEAERLRRGLALSGVPCEQCSCTCLRSQWFCCRIARSACCQGHRGDRGAVCPRPGREDRVRHDLPRASLLLLGDGARSAVRQPRFAAGGCRTNTQPRRLIAAVHWACRQSGSRFGRRDACGRSRGWDWPRRLIIGNSRIALHGSSTNS